MTGMPPTCSNIVIVRSEITRARDEAYKARERTHQSYEKLATSSAKLEKRIKNNSFHITLERAISSHKQKGATA